MAHIFAKSVMTRSTLRVSSNTVQQQKMRSFRDNRGKATVRRIDYSLSTITSNSRRIKSKPSLLMSLHVKCRIDIKHTDELAVAQSLRSITFSFPKMAWPKTWVGTFDNRFRGLWTDCDQLRRDVLNGRYSDHVISAHWLHWGLWHQRPSWRHKRTVTVHRCTETSGDVSCRKETARSFVSMNISLSHSY